MKRSESKVLVKVDGAVKELADMIESSLREDYHSDLEPFEAYAQKVRANIYKTMQEFQARFVNGYETLLKEIEKDKKNGST
jgi:hypothetical protein